MSVLSTKKSSLTAAVHWMTSLQLSLPACSLKSSPDVLSAHNFFSCEMSSWPRTPAMTGVRYSYLKQLKNSISWRDFEGKIDNVGFNGLTLNIRLGAAQGLVGVANMFVQTPTLSLLVHHLTHRVGPTLGSVTGVHTLPDAAVIKAGHQTLFTVAVGLALIGVLYSLQPQDDLRSLSYWTNKKYIDRKLEK